MTKIWLLCDSLLWQNGLTNEAIRKSECQSHGEMAFRLHLISLLGEFVVNRFCVSWKRNETRNIREIWSVGICKVSWGQNLRTWILSNLRKALLPIVPCKSLRALFHKVRRFRYRSSKRGNADEEHGKNILISTFYVNRGTKTNSFLIHWTF